MLDYEPTWSEWFYVFAPFQIYLMTVAVLACYGDHYDEPNWLKAFFKRISNCLERWTGFAGWSMAGALTGLVMLGTAAIGLYWDVAFHVDVGRDQQLFTPSHTMIVLGLGGIIFAAAIATLFATLDQAPVDLHVGPIRLPWTALATAMFGIGGLVAFPFDAIWHEAYGVDVTLWSPSHLQLIGGGALVTVILWLMLLEGRKRREHELESTMLGRGIQVLILGAVLVGLSTVQGEFDFGVPQFQVVYLPVLIAAAAGLGLVLGRLALGPWGAMKTILAYVIIRGIIGLMVAGPFNLTFPNFPLYVVAGLLIEGVAVLLGTQQRLRFAVVAGALAGTVGTFADVAFLSALSDVDPTGNGFAKAAVLSLITGVAAAVLGAALARPVRDGGHRVPAAAAGLAGLVLVAAIAYPLPRNVGNVEADIRVRPVGNGDRAMVEVDLQPADAAESATAFGVVSWQGGGRISSALKEVGRGRYVTEKAVPVTGSWKTMIGLQRDDEVMAAAVYMPEDAEIGAPAVPALPERHEKFVRNTTWLLREQKAGGAFAANAAYAGVGVVLLIWIGMYALCAAKVARDEDDTIGVHPTPPVYQPPADRRPTVSSNGTPPADRETVDAGGWQWGERWPSQG